MLSNCNFLFLVEGNCCHLGGDASLVGVKPLKNYKNKFEPKSYRIHPNFLHSPEFMVVCIDFSRHKAFVGQMNSVCCAHSKI